MGIYLDPQDAIRDSLRRTFRAYGMEPFLDEESILKIGAFRKDRATESAPSVDMTMTKEEVEAEEMPEEVDEVPEEVPEDVEAEKVPEEVEAEKVPKDVACS